MPRWLRRIVLEAPSVSVAVMLAICGGVFLFRAGRPELFDTMGPLVVVLLLVHAVPERWVEARRKPEP